MSGPELLATLCLLTLQYVTIRNAWLSNVLERPVIKSMLSDMCMSMSILPNRWAQKQADLILKGEKYEKVQEYGTQI